MKKIIIIFLFLFILKDQLSAKDIVSNNSFNNEYDMTLNQLDFFEFKGNENIINIGIYSKKILAKISSKIPNGTIYFYDLNTAIDDQISKNDFDMIICIQNNPWGRNDFLFNSNYLNLINSIKSGIIVDIPNESYHFLLIKNLLQTAKWQKYADFLIDNNFSLDDYRNLLIKKYNLNILHFQIEKKIFTYNNRQSLKASIGNNIHNFIKLPNNLIDEFIDDLTDLATKHSLKLEDEKIHIPYQVLTIIFDKLS